LIPIWASRDKGEQVMQPAWFFCLVLKPRGIELFTPIWAPGSKSEPVAQPTWFLNYNITTGKPLTAGAK